MLGSKRGAEKAEQHIKQVVLEATQESAVRAKLSSGEFQALADDARIVDQLSGVIADLVPFPHRLACDEAVAMAAS